MVSVSRMSPGAASPLTQPMSYPTRVVAGHTLVDLPGGWFVQGSAKCSDATPRWVRLSPFSTGIAPVAEAQVRPVMGVDGPRGGNPASTPEMPATCVSWDQAVAYCVAVNTAQGTSIGLLTDAEWEYAGRGPAVDLRAVMKAAGINPTNFAHFADERYENFVTALEPGARIFTDASDTELRRLLQTDAPLYAWCMYAPAGRLDKETAWYDRDTLPNAEWGPDNGFGLKGVTGGVWEWCADTYTPDAHQTLPTDDPVHLTNDRAARSGRGGARNSVVRDGLRLAYCLDVYPGALAKNVGFRVRARPRTPNT